MLKLADFKTDAKSWWCPGCGDFGVLAALKGPWLTWASRLMKWP